MNWQLALLVAVPLVTAVGGAVIGALVAAARTRAALEAKLREFEQRAVRAEAASTALGKKVEALKSDIVDDVRDSIDNSLFRFFTDVKTRIAQNNDLASVRKIVERGFLSTVQQVEQLRAAIGGLPPAPAPAPAAEPPPPAKPQRAPTAGGVAEPRVARPPTNAAAPAAVAPTEIGDGDVGTTTKTDVSPIYYARRAPAAGVPGADDETLAEDLVESFPETIVDLPPEERKTRS